MPKGENQDSGIVSSGEVEKRPSATKRRAPREITKAARAVAEGDLDSLPGFEDRIRPKLTEIALRLLRKSDLDLPVPELTGGFLDWYLQEYRLQIQDRSELYELAERFISQQLQLRAEPRKRAEDDPRRRELARLLAVEEEDLNDALAERALKGVEDLEPGHCDWIRLKLDFAQVGIADVTPFWRELRNSEPPEARDVLPLFRTRYQHLIGDAEADDLDRSADARYREDDFLTPQRVPTDTGRETPADRIDALRAENQALRKRLEAAESRIRDLEGQLGEDDLDTSQVRREVEALFDQPSLDDVPLLTGGTYEEQMEQFRANYGKWLHHFGAEYDQVSLPAIRAHDPEGLQRLTVVISRRRQRERQRYGEERTPTLGQIVPTESDVGDIALKGKTVEEVLADRRLASILSSRLLDRVYRQ